MAPLARRDERGISLIEVAVASVVLAIVVPIFGPTMISSLNSGAEVQKSSDTIDELRMTLTAIGREMRSATCIAEPLVVAPATSQTGAQLTFDTVANNVPTPETVTYKVVGGALVRETATGTRTIATGIVDSSDAFQHIDTPRDSAYIHFHVQLDPDKPPMTIETTVAGRNAWHAC